MATVSCRLFSSVAFLARYLVVAAVSLSGAAYALDCVTPGCETGTKFDNNARGDTTCKYGDADCNRCATNVADQFKRAFETGHRPWLGWHSRSWTFSGNAKYPPDRMKPEYAFRGTAKHIQGFVRTNSSRFPYAGSHSHRDMGSIFFVEREGGKLHSLYRSHYNHPSGVAVLGDGLFVAEEDRLRRFSITVAGGKQYQWYDIPRYDSQKKGLQGAGGGLGLAKLYDGTTLLIVSAPGSGFRKPASKAEFKKIKDNLRVRYTRFYRLVPNAFDKNGKALFLGEWKHEGISEKPKNPLAYSENVSVVTECESGRIYTIHTTGDYALKGDGYWRLSRVELELGSNKEPRLVHLQTARQDQHNERCHHRSSATVHVNPKGKLEFLCSERAVIRWHPTGRFNFQEGAP